MLASKWVVRVSNYQKVMKVKTLITSILIMFAATSLTFAQSNEAQDAMLLAKADTKAAVGNVITKSEEPGDISLLTRGGLAAGVNDQTYESDSLNVEDFPLVISTADKKKVSIVFPPFLYFKTKF